jgi:hypothetical protein
VRGVYVDVLIFEVNRFRHCTALNRLFLSVCRHREKLESRPLLGMRDFDMIAAESCRDVVRIYNPICILELQH